MVAARAEELRAIGVDAELSGRLEETLFPRILTERELAVLDGRSAELRRTHATRMFCAKESIHKNVSPIWGKRLAFRDVSIDLADGRGRGSFSVVPESPEAADLPWRDFSGVWIDDGRVSAAVGFFR